jgi:UDP-N-acetylglucosamine 1-carboxyvinyltransferase
MDKFLIWGGEPLQGETQTSGCKNSVLPVLAACLLADSPSTITNCPWLKDVDTMVEILEAMGVRVQRTFEGALTIDPTTLASHEAPYDLVRKMRASIYVLGALLGRLGKAVVSIPGGCVIGPRPIDLHLKGFADLGATIEHRCGNLYADAKELVGCEIFLGGPQGSSVGATANVLMAAVKAKGTTVITSAACEPEIVDLAGFLIRMGAKLTGAGTPTITVEGVSELHGVEGYEVIPDRIEAGTFMAAAAVTHGKVTVKGTEPAHLKSVTSKLVEAGVKVDVHDGDICVDATAGLKPMELVTQPHPGFPTDLQAQFMAAALRVPGMSLFVEKIYPNRFMHVMEYLRLGANISMDGNRAIVHGVERLSGAPIMASDLRASAGLVLAGLAATGETRILRVYHIDRGYEDIEEKLTALGAKIKRVKAE